MKDILPLPKGSDISIIDLLYYTQWKCHNDHESDVLMIVYKDHTGKKRVATISKPEADIYFTKPEYRDEWLMPREHVEFEKVYPVTCKYNAIRSTIYKEMQTCSDRRTKSLLDIYHRASEIGDNRSKKEIFKWQHTFMSDLPIEDYYRIKLITDYNTDFAHQISRAFLDIESDVYGLTSYETKTDQDRTNAITVIFDPINKEEFPQVYTFLLRDYKKYPQQKAFEENIDLFEQACHDEFDTITIKRKKKKIKRDCRAEYHFKFFDNDGDLIQAIFDVINNRRPDTLGVWNIAYDFPKMYARLQKNGLNPVDVMSDKAFPKDVRFVDMHIDNRPGVGFAEKKTYIRLTSTTKPYDQTNVYAGTRKGGKAYGSDKLDNIAFIELGIKKREFEGKGVTVLNAPVKEYWNFILYNINDVWLQRLIDDVTYDTMSYFVDTNTAGSAMENAFKQTRYQKTIYYAEKIKKGYVSGNNVNIDYVSGIDEDVAEYMEELKNSRTKIRLDDDELEDDDDTEADGISEEEPDEELNAAIEEVLKCYNDSEDRKIIVKGGLVGSPNLKVANGVELIRGVLSKHFFDFVADMDFASEYPWAKITRSISKSTQYGRLIIPNKVSDRQNVYLEPNYLPGGEFVADYLSADMISMGNTWFNLPTVETLLHKLDKESA